MEPGVATLLMGLRATTYADTQLRFDALLHPGQRDQREQRDD